MKFELRAQTRGRPKVPATKTELLECAARADVTSICHAANYVPHSPAVTALHDHGDRLYAHNQVAQELKLSECLQTFVTLKHSMSAATKDGGGLYL